MVLGSSSPNRRSSFVVRRSSFVTDRDHSFSDRELSADARDLLQYGYSLQRRGRLQEAVGVFEMLASRSEESFVVRRSSFVNSPPRTTNDERRTTAPISDGIRERARQALNAINGRSGFTLARAEYLADRTMEGLFDPAALGAMVGAGLTFRVARFGLLSSAARLGLRSSLVSPAVSLLAFGAEAGMFPVYGRLGRLALGQAVDWSSESLSHDIQSSFLVLGGLRLFGWAGNQSLRWLQGPSTASAGLSRRLLSTLVPQTAMYLGILGGQQAEQWAGLAPETSAGQLLAESFITLAHFNAAGRLIPIMSGVRLGHLERQLDHESGRIGRRWLDEMRTGLQHLTQGPRLAFAENTVLSSHAAGPESLVPGPRSLVPGPSTPLLGPAILMMESAGPGGQAPAIRRGIRVRPDQMAASIGRGSMLTTRGGTDATRAAAMKGIDHPETLARLAEDFRLVRWTGRDDSGQDQWVRLSDGQPISREEIAREFGEQLLRESGVREIPLEGNAQRLPVRHGALLPEVFLGSERVLQWMGLTRSEIKGTPLEDQIRNYEYASNSGTYGFWAMLAAQVGFGYPLHFLVRERGLHSSRFGGAQGSAAPGIENWIKMYLTAADRGRDSATFVLQSALLEDALGIYLNTVMPRFSFRELVENPRAIERILPLILASGEMPHTGGVNLAISKACASLLYALWGVHRALIRTGIPGEHAMDAMMSVGSDATFSPYHTAPMAAGFSRKAPATILDMMATLRVKGRLPQPIAEAYDRNDGSREALWDQLPGELRRQAMNESSAPFTRFASGLVVGEAAAAIPWMNFQRAIEMGLWPSSLLLGIHVNSGEGGAANLAGMDQGVVTAARVALQMTEAHGVTPRLVQAHGTSTALNNIAELQSLYQALRYQGISEPMAISAIKGLVGHAMGAASAVDMVMGVQSLLEGEAPGLFNFRREDIDPRYAERIPEVLEQFQFSSEPIRNFGDGILILSEGFLSADAAAVLGRFPQTLEEAADRLRDYNFPSHVIAEWKSRAPEHRERVEDLEQALRRGDLTYRDIALRYGFNE